MADKRAKPPFIRIIRVILIALAVFLMLKFALPVFLPFVLALLTARLIETPVRLISRRLKIKRGVAAAACSLLVLSAISALIVLALTGIIRALASFTDSLPQYLSSASGLARTLEERILQFISTAPDEIKAGLGGAYDGVIDGLSALPAKLSSKLLHVVSSIITCAPNILLFAVTYTVSVFFFSSGYPSITGFIMRQLPDSVRGKAAQLKSAMFGTLCIWLRSQLVLIGVTFVELSAAFLLLGVSSPFIIALFVTAVDALPVLGTGTVLIPWAILSVITGNTPLGVGLAVSYGVIYIVRSFLEPKIVSAQIGLHPLAAICAAYVGFRVAGIAGMIASPLILMVLKVLNDNKIVRLWKSPPAP